MSLLDLENAKRVMVFAAHPDDEIIGPGGAIHKLAGEGKEICIISFTCGGTAAQSEAEAAAMVESRKREMESCDQLLGTTSREVLEYASQQLYGAAYLDNKLHQRLIGLIRKYRPDLLFSHSPDNHRDHDVIHAITSQSVFQASEHILVEQLGEPWSVPLVLYFGIEKELQGLFVPNVIIEIDGDDLQAKLDAMATQLSQTRGGYLEHFQEMMTGRAQLWGAKIFGAGRFAEAFHLADSIPIRMEL